MGLHDALALMSMKPCQAFRLHHRFRFVTCQNTIEVECDPQGLVGLIVIEPKVLINLWRIATPQRIFRLLGPLIAGPP